jgi:hypothetical protein
MMTLEEGQAAFCWFAMRWRALAVHITGPEDNTGDSSASGDDDFADWQGYHEPTISDKA